MNILMPITKDWKNKLGYMAFASLFTAIGMILSPVTGQFTEEPARFGEIVCTTLSVVQDGVPRVVLGSNERSGGGAVVVCNSDGDLRVILGSEEESDSGTVAVYGGTDRDLRIVLGSVVNGDSGTVRVFGSGKSQAVVGIDNDGNGFVHTWDRHGNSID